MLSNQGEFRANRDFVFDDPKSLLAIKSEIEFSKKDELLISNWERIKRPSGVVLYKQQFLALHLKWIQNYSILTNNNDIFDVTYMVIQSLSGIVKFDWITDLPEGSIVGDKGLDKNVPRSATCICREACDLGVLSKNDYVTMLKALSQQEQEKKIEFLFYNVFKKSMPLALCDKLSYDFFKNEEKRKRGDVIYEQGSRSSYIYILKSGEISLSRKIVRNDPAVQHELQKDTKSRVIDIKISLLEPGQFFGDDNILNGGKFYFFESECAKDCVLLKVTYQCFFAYLQQFPDLRSLISKSVKIKNRERAQGFKNLMTGQIILAPKNLKQTEVSMNGATHKINIPTYSPHKLRKSKIVEKSHGEERVKRVYANSQSYRKNSDTTEIVKDTLATITQTLDFHGMERQFGKRGNSWEPRLFNPSTMGSVCKALSRPKYQDLPFLEMINITSVISIRKRPKRYSSSDRKKYSILPQLSKQKNMKVSTSHCSDSKSMLDKSKSNMESMLKRLVPAKYRRGIRHSKREYNSSSFISFNSVPGSADTRREQRLSTIDPVIETSITKKKKRGVLHSDIGISITECRKSLVDKVNVRTKNRLCSEADIVKPINQVHFS